MNFIFIHQNAPGQYIHIARHLANAGHNVLFIGQNRNFSDTVGDRDISGIRTITYATPEYASPVHPNLHDTEAGVLNGLAVAQLCAELKRQGYVPDLVAGHNGWGETLYIKDVWPTTPLLGYFEFFYHARGVDADFDSEFPSGAHDAMRIRTRNAINLLGLDAADWGQTPTFWQRDQYPACFHDKISVVHEGIDTDRVHPDPQARIWLGNGQSFAREDEVVTYCARNLEPYRGFHVFMRALPGILRARPRAHVLIVGGDSVSYGRRPTQAATWRQQLLAELGSTLDLRRIHFLGRAHYRQYLAVLQISSVHVYFTYPFVLSWSLLEAMAAGCLVIGSRTRPVEEVIEHGANGYLADFFDIEGLTETVSAALATKERHEHIRAAARATVVQKYDLHRVCLPAHVKLLRELTASGGGLDVPAVRAASAAPTTTRLAAPAPKRANGNRQRPAPARAARPVRTAAAGRRPPAAGAHRSRSE
jgi:glycosyltransferase involved in cell wall biosynthesis